MRGLSGTARSVTAGPACGRCGRDRATGGAGPTTRLPRRAARGRSHRHPAGRLRARGVRQGRPDRGRPTTDDRTTATPRPRRRRTATTATTATTPEVRAAQRARRLQGGRRRPSRGAARPQALAAAPERQAHVHRDPAHELRHDPHPPRRARRSPKTTASFAGPRAQRVLRRADVSPDRQAGRQRLRHPGRRPAGHRQRRSRLHASSRTPPRDTRYRRYVVGDGQGRRPSAGHVGQPVLHRHRRRGAAAAPTTRCSAG